MADEIPKPTQQQALESLIRLGKALHAYAYPRSPMGLARALLPHEANRLKEEIAACEKVISTAACDPSHRHLRSVLDVRRDLIPNSLDIRIVAYVAWHSLTSEPSGTSVAVVSKAAGLDSIEEMIQARHAIRYMLVGRIGVLVLQDQTELLPGEKLVRLLSGDNKPPILFTEETLKNEAEAGQRMKAANFRKSVSPPSTNHAPSAPLPPTNAAAVGNLDSPKAIYESLRKTVIGMDPVVRRFSVQMAMHLKRVAIADKGGVPSSTPVCVLLCGVSGSGKTFIASEFGKISGLPFAVGDMSSVTASAYVGTSVDELFYGFMKKGTTLSDVQRGILFLDEIDKKRTNNRGGDFDATGVGVQYELLRMLEGARIQIGGKRGNDSSPRGFLETGSMAFILGGAFSSVSAALADKKNKAKGPIGFSCGSDATRMAPDVRELLLDYFIPELVNRIGSVIVVPTPSLSQLIEIASAPTGIIAKQNQYLMSSFGIQVQLSPDAIQEIAAWSLETKTFARGMRSLLQTLVEESIFEELKGDLNLWKADVRRAIDGLRREPEGLA